MKYLSLFTGIGGFELGIKKAYVETTNRKKNGGGKKTEKKGNRKRHEKPESFNAKRGRSSKYNNCVRNGQEPFTCVGYSEIDKHAIQIYEKHFPEHKNFGDIRKIKPKKLPDFDLLVGGFPCQSFSIAGKRLGFKDTRGTLFFDIARIIKTKRPRLLLLENVKGLLSHDEGQTFAVIIRTLDGLGYDIQWQVLNSKDFGVPQNRERVFIVGHLRGTPRPEIFPFTENNSEDIILPTITTRITADSNGTYVSKKSPQVGTYRTHKSGQGFRKSKSGLVPTIPARAREDGSGQPVIMGGLQAHQKPRQDGLSPTLTTAMGMGGGQTPIVNAIRRLTPIECERLQGFPDDWTAIASDTQRYKTLGNAVTVNVVRKIALRLLLVK